MSTAPSCGYRSCFRDGLHTPLCRLHSRWSWPAVLAQQRTDQTRWRQRLCSPRCLLSLTLSAPLNAPPGRTAAEERCTPPSAGELWGSGWHSSLDFWTKSKSTDTQYNLFDEFFTFQPFYRIIKKDKSSTWGSDVTLCRFPNDAGLIEEQQSSLSVYTATPISNNML